MSSAAILFISFLLDLILGDPMGLPHPVVYIGKLISKTEKIIRERFTRLKIGGAFLLFIPIAVVMIVIRSVILLAGRVNPLLGDIVTIYILYTSLASRCLAEEARKVYRRLKSNDLKGARIQIGYLVGRDTTELDYGEIRRATVETVAENTIDGVIAPLFYIALGIYLGLPAELVYGYKVVNTLDSMVGYKNERYGDIGFFSAKFDDLLNYLPARIGGVLMAIAGGILRYDFKAGLSVMIRDRKNHKSPNCAYPEGAVAGLLGIQLGGSNVYFGELVYKPTIGDALREVEDDDIERTVNIMYLSSLVSVVLILATLVALKGGI